MIKEMIDQQFPVPDLTGLLRNRFGLCKLLNSVDWTLKLAKVKPIGLSQYQFPYSLMPMSSS